MSAAAVSLKTCPVGMQAAELVTKLPFPNAYGLSKYLAKALVAERGAGGLPTVIVRPTIIGCVAGTPYPGYLLFCCCKEGIDNKSASLS